jgi:WD40 repeat protein
LLIRDAGTGEVLHDWQVDRVAGATWLDGSRVAVGGEGSTRIVNIDTGRVLFELAGHTAPVLNSAAIPGTDLMATAGFDGALLIWDISPAGPTELPVWDTGLPASGFFFAGPDGGLALVPNSETGQALWWLADDGSPAALVRDDLVQARPAQDGTLLTFIGLDGTSGVVSLPYGEVVYTAPEGLEVHATNNDASLVVLGEPGFPETGQAPVVVDTVTGLEVSRLDAPWNDAYQFSPDASLVFSFCCGSWSVYLLPDGEATGGNEGFAARISDDGSILAYPPNLDGDIWLLDTEKLKATKDIESARVAAISAHSGLVFPDFSPDGSMLLTAAFDEPIRVWDIGGVLDGGQPRLIAEIDAEPRSGPPAAYFRPNGTHIVSRSVDGLLRVFTIDTDELIGIAQSRLTRTLTPEECATFGIDACPALEEAKAGTG